VIYHLPLTSWRRQVAAGMRKHLLLTIALMSLAAAGTASAQQSASMGQPSVATAASVPNQRGTAGELGLSPRRGGAITGRVLADDGRPLINATVLVSGVGVNAAGGEQGTARTDGKGDFRVADLAPGTYTITAQAPGYVTAPKVAIDGSEKDYYRLGDAVTIRMVKGGVITGKVINSGGEPIVGGRVRAIRVRASDGRPVRAPESVLERQTDDRGVYRLYGLEPGSYLVVLIGGLTFLPSAYEGDAPTYFPSARRESAVEVAVRSGEEVGGIDIRYRGERGRAVSGTISGALDAGLATSQLSVTLRQASSGAIQETIYLWRSGGNRAFAFYGVPDGDYELIARREAATEVGAVSAPRRVTVKGADVTGIDLKLAPLGSISGRVVLKAARTTDRSVDCESKGASSLEEVVIQARRDEAEGRKDLPRSLLNSTADGTPNGRGEFAVSDLDAGHYRIEARLPSERWYLRALTLPEAAAGKPQGTAPATPSNEAGRQGLTLKPGERVESLTVSVGEGAAQLSGRVIVEAGARPPARLRVHLVPAETDYGDETLRFHEALVHRDGAFAFSHIAPGGYWLIAHPVDERTEGDRRPVAWDGKGRAGLRREAEASSLVIVLQPCQRVDDYVLRYRPSPAN